MKYFIGGASSPFREWRGLACTFVWFFCSMFNFYEPLFGGTWTVFFFMALLCCALAFSALLFEKNPQMIGKAPLMATLAGAFCTALIPFLPSFMAVAVFYLSALFMAPLLCRRLYGILVTSKPKSRIRMYISTVSVTVVLHMIWTMLSLPYTIKFFILSVFALAGLWGAERRLPERVREALPDRVNNHIPVRRTQIIAIIVLLFTLNIFNTLIHGHVVQESLDNNDLYMLLTWAIVPVSFFVLAMFSDFGRERLGFALSMSFILIGCFVALLPSGSILTAPLQWMGEFGGTITEFCFLTVTLLFFPFSPRPFLIAVSGLIVHTISSALSWTQDLWLPEFLLRPELDRPLAIFGAVCVILLTPLVFSLWEHHREQTLMAALLGLKNREEEKAGIKSGEVPADPPAKDRESFDISILDWTHSLALVTQEHQAAMLLCEGLTRAQMAESLNLPAAQVSQLIRSIRAKLSALPPIGRSQAAANAIARYGLTQREAEVFDELLLGRSNAEIAAGLFIVEATVKFHVRNIFKKIGVSNRTQLFAQPGNGEHRAS